MRKTATQVIAEVCRSRNMTVTAIMAEDRRWHIAHPRQEAMFEVYVQCPHLSYPAIARAFGGMDHSSIIHGVKVHAKRMGLSYDDVRRRTRPYESEKPQGRQIYAPTSLTAYREAARL